MTETEKKYTADDLKDLTQRHLDHVCHYRNLAIVLGAKPNQMLTDYDKALCEKGIDPDDNGGGYHWSVRDCIEEVEDLWQKNEELRAEAERLRALKPVGTYSMDWNHEQERLRLTAELTAARRMLEGICEEFERAVAHADWRAAGSPGMSVPFHGDFASATQLPSAVQKMRWWAREMRAVLGKDK